MAWPELIDKRALLRSQVRQCLVLGALGMWVCGAWVCGARSTPANNIALLYALSPALIALASTIWLRERLAPRQWLGLALAFVGLVHVIIAGHWGALADFYGAAFAWMVVGEPVQWHHAVGAAIILPGIYLASRQPG